MSQNQKNFFLVQKYCHFHHLSLQQLDLQIPRLDNLPLACQEALHNKIVSDYHQIMNWMTSEIFVTMCAIKKFFFSVFWNLLRKFCFIMKKKNDIKKIDHDVSIVSSNNRSDVPAQKKYLSWVRGVFYCADGHI